MSRATSAELLPVLRERYGRRGRQARSGMLDEFCEQFGYSRKHAIKVLRAKLPVPGERPRPGPVRVYDADVLRVTKALWLAPATSSAASGSPRRWLCGCPLRGARGPAAGAAAAQSARDQPGDARPAARAGAGCAAAARAVRDQARQPAAHADCQRPPALPFVQRLRPLAVSLRSAPIHNEAWDVTRPGWLEADTVAHCGNSLAGDFI